MRDRDSHHDHFRTSILFKGNLQLAWDRHEDCLLGLGALGAATALSAVCVHELAELGLGAVTGLGPHSAVLGTAASLSVLLWERLGVLAGSLGLLGLLGSLLLGSLLDLLGSLLDGLLGLLGNVSGL